jgi:hypothetical protein
VGGVGTLPRVEVAEGEGLQADTTHGFRFTGFCIEGAGDFVEAAGEFLFPAGDCVEAVSDFTFAAGDFLFAASDCVKATVDCVELPAEVIFADVGGSDMFVEAIDKPVEFCAANGVGGLSFGGPLRHSSVTCRDGCDWRDLLRRRVIGEAPGQSGPAHRARIAT